MVAQQRLPVEDGTSDSDSEPRLRAARGADARPTPLVRPGAEPELRVARAILGDLFGPPAGRSFDVRLWDGSVEGPGTWLPPRFTLVLERPGALRRMFLPPSELALGQAYLRGDFDVEGELEEAVGLGDVLVGRLRSPATLARLVPRLLALPTDDLPATRGSDDRPGPRLLGRRHSRRRDAAAVRFHYDAGNDFYALWLDRRMMYSCAYFETGTEDLDAAQTAKLEHICRKLRLEPGERLLDVGCGWGGLVQYAAEQYGVRATGITLSERQAALARQRIAAAGLSDHCRVEVRDYRALAGRAAFDKVVSVGMVEHVGRAQLPAYFATAYRLLKPGGLFLNHGIVIPTPLRFPGLALRVERLRGGWDAFVQRYVFPDSELLAPGEMIHLGEKAGFETRDVENLRDHYALTLRHWVRRLEARHCEAVGLVGEPTYRVWRLYMAVAARGFATGKVGVIQTLLSKPGEEGSSGLPLTRADLYWKSGRAMSTGSVMSSSRRR